MEHCQYCKKEMEGKRMNAIYCSPSCRVRACNSRKLKLDPEKVLQLYYDLDYLSRKVRSYEPDEGNPQLSNNIIANRYINLKDKMTNQELIESIMRESK
jgi:hypothetical protein